MKQTRRAWGLAAAALLFILISFGFIDLPLARFFRSQSQEIRDLFEWITKAGISTPYLVVSGALIVFYRWIGKNRRLADRALLLFSGIALSGIVVNIIKFLVGRLRPKMFFEQGLYGFEPLRIGYEFGSMPSGHATTVFAVATTCSIYWPKYRIHFLLFATVVSLSRLVLNAHYLGDVFAGACLGMTTVILIKRYIPAGTDPPGADPPQSGTGQPTGGAA
ncbi:MAG: phosphatase PAP2 family protein [Thermodesulfobacteriota bacterium]